MSTKKQRSEAAALLASHRKRIVINCQICGTPVWKLTTAKFCSNRCRQINKRDKAKSNG